MEKFRVDDGGRECTTCHEYKPWDQYTKMKAEAYGKCAKCKACVSDTVKSKRVLKRVKKYDDNGRICTKCTEYKAWSEFSVDKSAPTGYKNWCRSCAKTHMDSYTLVNRDKLVAARRKFNAENRERVNERSRKSMNAYRSTLPAGAYAEAQEQWRQANKERYLKRLKVYRDKNPDRIKENNERCKAKNPHLYAAWDANKRTKRVKRYVTWADQSAIADVYAQAKFLTEVTGVQHHVDHIYPLQGKTVSGLHVHNNLRAIPAEINASKSNNLDPEHLPSDVLEELGVEVPITDQTTVIRVSGKTHWVEKVGCPA